MHTLWRFFKGIIQSKQSHQVYARLQAVSTRVLKVDHTKKKYLRFSRNLSKQVAK